MFQSEFLQPRTVPSSQAPELTARLAGFPMLLTLNPDEQAAIREAMARMFLDAQLVIGPHVLHALLRPQLQAVLQRLAMVHDRTEQAQQTAPTLLQRFRQFRDAVEQDFAREHRVAPYSRRIGCSEKSLGRACWAVAGLSAKSLVSQRIVLEARRLLVHTDLQIAEISEQLGFDEPTNFVKFFRREADITPGEFRRQQTLTPRAHLG